MYEEQFLLNRALESVRHLSDPEAPWEDVLRSAGALMGTDGAVLIVHRQGRVDMQQVGADPAAVRDYAQHFHTHDVLLSPGMTAPVGSWLDTQTILTSSQRERSSYYNDFMCHHRMRHLGAVILSRESPDHWTSFGLQRAQIDARLGERMTGEAVSRYLRELNAQVNARTRAAEQWLLAAESMFEGMEEAVLLVSPKGSVIQAGHTTRAKLRDAHVLRSNELWHPMESMRTSLSACLRHANEGQHGTALRIPTSDGGTLQLSFVKAAASLRLLNEDLVFVRVRFPSSLPIADAEVLRCSFSITPAEARVLCALMRGEVAKQYALREGVSIHTVRKQIATLLEKMNCTRQLELVQKAMTVLGR